MPYSFLLSYFLTYYIYFFAALSIYDEHLEAIIFHEGKELLKTNTIVDGILCLISVHYVFGFNYEPKNAKTMEFLQR